MHTSSAHAPPRPAFAQSRPPPTLQFAGVISSIPEAVLGGMVLFLFANVFVSGIAIISGVGYGLNRRECAREPLARRATSRPRMLRG